MQAEILPRKEKTIIRLTTQICLVFGLTEKPELVVEGWAAGELMATCFLLVEGRAGLLRRAAC
jgi:hypothetical protein